MLKPASSRIALACSTYIRVITATTSRPSSANAVNAHCSRAPASFTLCHTVIRSFFLPTPAQSTALPASSTISPYALQNLCSCLTTLAMVFPYTRIIKVASALSKVVENYSTTRNDGQVTCLRISVHGITRVSMTLPHWLNTIPVE